MQKLKAFDTHRKLPSDLKESTTLGALIGIVSIIIMTLLFLYEFKVYLTTEETSEMFIDVSQGEGKLRINIDIELPRMPCDIVSLDQQDIMGTHTLNIEGELHKVRLNKNGDPTESTFHKVESKSDRPIEDVDDQDHLDLDRTRKAFTENEGCRLIGFIRANRVPGNVHISSHAYGSYLNSVFLENNITTIDVSHKIHHFSFGEESDIKIIKSKFGKGILNPLDGTSKIPQNINSGISYQYYLNVVPTTFVTSRGRSYHVHQFTANSAEFASMDFPALFLKYELHSNTIKFSQEGVGFFHFLTQLCAIIGGVFTIASIIDAVLHKIFGFLLKKSDHQRLA